MILILTVGGFGFYQHYRNNSYNVLPQVESPTGVISSVKHNESVNKLTYEYYYRPHCKHCDRMRALGLVKNLKKTAQSNPLSAINVTKFNNANPTLAKQWLKTNNVIHTPTLVVRSHGYAIYTYSGMNKTIFTKLLAGINPETNKTLKLTNHPDSQIYKDDFDKTKSIMPSVKTDSLASLK